MLSRVADSLYWMSRYMERAENLARLMQASHELLLDGDTAGRAASSYWSPVLAATAMECAFSARQSDGGSVDVNTFMTLDRGNPDSILMCLLHARENARMVRDQISDEMWSELNELFLFMQSGETEMLFQRSPQTVYDRIIRGSLLFHGITSATLTRTEGWHFILLGKYLERAEKMTRFLDIRSASAAADNPSPESVQWATILRSASAFSAYRTSYGGEVTATGVVDLLLFSTRFPRSVRFCIREVDNTLHAISGTPPGTYSNEAERIAGRLLATLNFDSAIDVVARGTHAFIDELQSIMNNIGQAIFETYVLLPHDVNRITFAPAAAGRQVFLRSQQEQQQQQQ